MCSGGMRNEFCRASGRGPEPGGWQRERTAEAVSQKEEEV